MPSTNFYIRGCAALMLALSLTSTPARADIFRSVQVNGFTKFVNVTKNEYSSAFAEAAAERFARLRAGAKPPFAVSVHAAGLAADVEPALIHAVIAVESGYNPSARSNKGAVGLMQLMPATAKRYGVVDRLDPAQNIRGGTRYLRDLLQMFDNDLRLTLAAYNAGEGAVAKYGNRIPPYPETVAYVPRVLAHYRRFRSAS